MSDTSSSWDQVALEPLSKIVDYFDFKYGKQYCQTSMWGKWSLKLPVAVSSIVMVNGDCYKIPRCSYARG